MGCELIQKLLAIRTEIPQELQTAGQLLESAGIGEPLFDRIGVIISIMLTQPIAVNHPMI